MTTEHTPGPWVSRREYANRWRIEQEVPDSIVPFSIALVTTTVLEVGSDNGSAPANACLIAAAPDLLVALQSIYDLVAEEVADGEYTEQAKQARAAIAKATGAAS